MSACLACGRGFHRECKRCSRGACHPQEENHATRGLEQESNGNGEPQKRKKTEEGLKDPKSTGRKRAAKIYPIDLSAPCEWRGLRDCGGGSRPIIGCLDGNQKHRHHGPIKDPRRNHEGNVHRICSACHVHWHELNDLVYDEEKYRLLPHNPVPATDLEIVQNIMDWKTGEMGKRFELASSKNLEKYNASQLDLLAQNLDED